MKLSLRLTRWLNQLYRRIKAYLCTKRPPIVTPVFFTAIGWMDGRLSGRRQTEGERLNNTLWKVAYFARWPAGCGCELNTKDPVAYTSDDHLFPRGTILDNSVNPRFNARLYAYLDYRPGLRFLDLGCAGGGLVRSFLADGHFALGLEGSDSSKRLRSGEWDTIPHHLFTCDLTKEFTIVDGGCQVVQFDAITAWEVFEHIAEPDLEGLLARIHRHLRPGGSFVGSIDLLPDGNPLTGAVYHKTLRPKDWWYAQFARCGFEVVLDHPFRAEDMVRGHGMSFKDWYPDDQSAIHVVARRKS